jgi:hypothetical protein
VVIPNMAGGLPLLTGLGLPEGQPSARPGDAIVLIGRGLEGAEMSVRFESPVLPAPIELAPDAGGSAARRTVTLPDAPATWAAGPYRISFVARSAPGAPLLSSNAVVFQLAPLPVLPPDDVVRTPEGRVEVTLSARPNLWPGQRVELALGAEVAVAAPRAAPTGTAVFSFGELPAGAYPVRLRVEGTESWLVLREVAPQPPDFLPEPPVFDPAQTLTVPA